MRAYAHPVASVKPWNSYADVVKSNVHTVHAWCSTTPVNACILSAKCIWTRACAPMQRCRSFLAMKASANLSWVLRHEHRAGCRLPPALLPARRNQSPDTVRSRNLSKSTLAHDAVTLPSSPSMICIHCALLDEVLVLVVSLVPGSTHSSMYSQILILGSDSTSEFVQNSSARHQHYRTYFKMAPRSTSLIIRKLFCKHLFLFSFFHDGFKTTFSKVERSTKTVREIMM